MAVTTETKTGTMTDEAGRVKATPATEVKTPEAGSKVSPEEEVKLYTQKQLDTFLHATKSEAGRVTKEVEKERDSLKSQIMTKESQIEDNQTDIESLQKKIDDLTSDDPARFDAIKEIKAAREERRQLKADKYALDAEKQAHVERIKKADAFEMEVLCEEIADEYENGNSKILQTICSSTGLKDKEVIRNIADTLWKKSESATEPTPITYSGHTEGGGTESFEQLLKVNVKKLSYQERLEHQKKLNEARKSIT